MIDREGAEPEWVEIAALWPTKKRTGFTGRIEKLQVLPEGARLDKLKSIEEQIAEGSRESSLRAKPTRRAQSPGTYGEVVRL